MMKMATVTEKALKASYLTLLRIAKSKKAHTIGEELLQPAAVEMCELIVGPEAANQLWLIPLSSSTVYRRIEDMSSNILDQLIERLEVCRMVAIQLMNPHMLAKRPSALSMFGTFGRKAYVKNSFSAKASQNEHQAGRFLHAGAISEVESVLGCVHRWSSFNDRNPEWLDSSN